ncbi:DUF4390 domain-containing protein [Solidesulfovibrio sp.]|uniref:DUF4390 domain-containing protein n=1 Tax=Solidesulfovibrio sp. TaxID=2910990 RepID=UPI00260600D9|nr:DUF4390 domain-containing protein [Solidesulfovibrio sp.]
MPFFVRHMRRLTMALALAAAAVLVAAGPSRAQELLLSNLVLNNFEGKIWVRFGVEPTGADAIRQVLMAGERLALVCKAKLSVKRDYVWNREVSSARYESVLRRLKGGEFAVELPGQGAVADRELAALFRKAWGEILIDLGPWDRLERGQTYALTLELSLTRLDVSPWLKKGLFFWPFDPATPVSYQLDFTY